MNQNDIKKIKDLSKETNLSPMKKLYQKIINKLMNIIVYVIEKNELDNSKLDYFIVKKDHIFLYEDLENSYAFNPNGWGVDD